MDKAGMGVNKTRRVKFFDEVDDLLECISFAEYGIVYWDLPEKFVPGNRYLLYKNGEKIGETEKCHFRVENLSPEETCTIQVSMTGKTEASVGEISVTAEKRRVRLDVTRAPYGAVGDGKTMNTKAIQAAIDDCQPGQSVYLPAGDYMTGALFLHSDMELYLEEGAILHGTADIKDYEPKIQSRFEGVEMMAYAGLVNIGELDREKGLNCFNVRICGGGTICGGGLALAEKVVEVETVLMKDYLESLGDKIKECEKPYTIPARVRPRLVNISCAKNVVLSDVTIQNGPSWNVHMIYSDQIVTQGCTFRSEGVWNGDGWDPDSSTNCTIFGCDFYTGDDAVAIKSGKNPQGNLINRPCEHIRVFDCVSHAGHGITIGSEMSGGVSDVRIWNCDMSKSVFGVEIKGTKKRGGYVRDVQVRNTKVCSLLMHSVGYNDDGDPAPTVPVFENCLFEDVEITACRLLQKGQEKLYPEGVAYCEAIGLSGFDVPGHFIKNVAFKNIIIDSPAGSRKQTISLQCCEGISFENIYCR